MTALDITDPDFHLGADGDPTTYRGTPYTGQAVERAPDGTLIGRWSFLDGYDDGPSEAWYADGTPASVGLMRRGLAAGEWREWHRDGTRASLEVYSSPGYLRLRKRWDEHGVLLENRLLTGPPGDPIDLRPLGYHREMFDGDRDDLPSIRDALGDAEHPERARLLAYLRAAPVVFDRMTAVPDLLAEDGWLPGGASLCSDGEWIWRAELVEYYARQPLTLPVEFVEHVRENGYRPAGFDLADPVFQDAVTRHR
ncbi:hypothetical protein [Nocardia sp. AG03]|uniref:toxin-antitoxin system YwqK family antitoxin n=1 Tax=Nocardia sp. AG03 TaxID=3025312 RepID=UPI002418A9C0|nr:hypothetical protein [Nocardia sp. AG03]